MADIDELKFSIILDDNKFKQKMEEVNAAAEKFEKSVKAALAVQNLLDAAQSKGVKSAEQKAQSAEKSAAAAKKEAAAMSEQEKEEEKVYKLVELRRKRKEQSGQLTNDEVQVLKQMESIEKALLNIREQHKGKLAEEFGIMMNEEGMTRQQVGSYQSLVTQMQAATSESAKREAAEKAALTLREQKENAILALNRTLAGVNQELLSAETKINIQKGLSGELTAKEIASLQIVIATENKRNAAQKRADAEKQAAENALIGLRQTLVGINQKILSEEVKQKIAKAEAGQLTSKEISQLNAQIALEKSKTNEMERQRASAASISSQLTRQTSIMKGLTSYVAQYASIFGAATILRNLIRITGEFEAQHVALRAILQDSVAADNIYNQLQVLAVKSPYTFQDLVSYAKQLTAFSIPVNEVYETTKKLADVSAGLGVDMGRIILAYGQVRSAEFLRGQEVRQFTEAGIPILAELAKQFSEIEGHAISVGEVFNRISARQVPFAMVEEAFNRMTSAGGKFYNMQEVLAETVKGKISNLQDAWEIMLSKIGNENSGMIKGIVTMMTNLFANYEKWIGYVSAVVKGLGLYTAALAVSNGITKFANAGQALHNSLLIIKNAQLKLSTILIPTNNAVQKAAIANNMKEAATLATLNVARSAALGILSMLATVGFLVYQKFKGMREENEALSRSMDELTRSYRENLSLFAAGWNDVEKAYKKVTDERHNAYRRALEENKGLLPDISESAKKIINDSAKLVAPVETIRRKIEEVSIYGGELDAAVVVADRSIKQLVADGGELEAAVISVSKETKQLVSDGGELDAAVVVADRSIKQLVADGGELEAAVISVSKETKQLVSDGGELDAAVVVADRSIKQLVADGGELEAAVISVSKETKQLVSDGGELDAAVVVADRSIKQLVADGGELEAAVISVSKETKQLVSDGGELDAAVVVADRSIKQLVADGGELEAALVIADAKVKQLVSDGGELEAAIVTASGVLPKLNSALVDTAHSLKEVGLAGEPVKGSQVDIEKQFSASEKTVKDYKDALNDLYEKFPNFIDENVRQKIAVEDLAGAWDAATQNMKQYYAENASHQAHEILLKDYKEDTNKIVEDLNAQLRTGRKFKQYRKNGLINEGSIQLLDAYVMGLKTKDELSGDLQRLVELLNSVGEQTYSAVDVKGDKVDTFMRSGDNIIDKARDNYLARMQEFREAANKADADIEKDFTSTRHRQVREYLLGIGVAEDSELMMREGEDEFESWESWQGRLRKGYEEMSKENQKVVSKMFNHFGLVVSAGGLTPAQYAISKWMTDNPAPNGVSMAGFEIKPETNVAEFAENALKQMQDDAKALARLPKEFQKTEGQGWNEYAEMLEDEGEATSAALARRVQYFERMSQEIWEDDVFGSSKELLKKEKQSKKSWEEFRRDKIADLKQQFKDLKELKSAYDQFEGLGFNDKQIDGLLMNFKGRGIPKGGFGNAFESLAKEMDKYSANDANDIRNYITGKDSEKYAKSIEDAGKATAKFRESLEDLAATTKRLKLEGFAAELDKIVVDTDSKNRKLRTDWSQKLDDLSKSKDGWIAKFRVEHPDQDAERAWEDFYAAQKKALDELIQTQIEYNNKVAQGQIDKKAESWMKEMMDKNNINLSDMGDKSLAQVNVLIERMQTLVSDEALSKLLPPELKQDAELINASFSKLLSNVKKIANTKLGDLRVEKMKKTMDGVKALMSTLGISADTSAVSESYSTLSQRLTEVADAQQEVADAQVRYNAAKREGDLDREAEAYTALAMAVGKYQSASEAAQNAQREFVTTLAVASVGVFASGLGKVGDMLKKIGEASEDADLVGLGDAMSRVSQNLNAAAAGFAAAYSAGAGAYSWIGAVVGGLSDIIGQIATATSEHTKMLTENKERLKDYYVAYHATLLEMEEFTNIFGEQVSRSARDAYDKMIAAADKARKYYSQLKNSKVITDHKGFWESGNTEWWYLRTLYPGLFDEDGHINTDLASRLIKDLPTGSSSKSRDWNSDLRDTLQLAIDAENAWKEAKEALDGYISSFTGDWASSLAEVMWNAVASGEDAWEEWHDVASEAISDIGKQMLTEMIQKAWLSQYQKELEDAFSSGDSPDEIWAKVAEISERMFKDVDNNHEKLYNITKEFQDRMAAAGYEVYGAESDSSVANGFKSITEDTANLLASYVNAIRADVSYGRILWGRIAVAVEGQANRYATLNDYLAKVQADTANIAASNQKILESLDGFVRDFSMASDYGDSLKVQIVN